MTTSTRSRRAPTTTIPEVGAHRTPGHVYYFNGQGPYPGVTTVTNVLDKPALTYWHREQVAKAALEHAERLVQDRQAGNVDAAVKFLLNVRTDGTAARDRGTRIHAALEAILQHRNTGTILDADLPAIEGARAWLNQHQVKPLAVEAFLLNQAFGYGGTCDLIAEIDGETWLLDWKSSKSVADAKGNVWQEMRLQLAAYARAEFIAQPADPNRYAIPTIQRFVILHVTDGGTRLYPADVTEDDWIAFRACLYLNRWSSGVAA